MRAIVISCLALATAVMVAVTTTPAQQRAGGEPSPADAVMAAVPSGALYARVDDGMPIGTVFVAFCYYEAAANLLTNPALDPYGKIPEFKYCAVKVAPGGRVMHRAAADEHAAGR